MTINEVVNRCVEAINSTKVITKKDIELWGKFLWEEEIEFRKRFIKFLAKEIAEDIKNSRKDK
jgi:hypothetical protein